MAINNSYSAEKSGNFSQRKDENETAIEPLTQGKVHPHQWMLSKEGATVKQRE